MLSTKNNDGSSFVDSATAESEKYPTTIHYGYELLKECNIFHDTSKLEEIISNVERQILKKEEYSKEEAINILKTTHKEIENLGFKYIEKEFDCKSYSLIALAVGEKFNLPLYGVYAPQHIFIRYAPNEKQPKETKKPSGIKKLINLILPFSGEKNLSNEKEEVFNWEATRGYILGDDEDYKKFFNISEESINNKVYLKNLKKQELISFFYFVKGNDALEKENLNLAFEDFNKAIELNPLDLGTYYGRAIVHSEKENFDSALEDFDKVIELNPLKYDAYYNRGTLHLKKGNFDSAIEDLNKSIELNPLESDAYCNRGLVYGRKGMLFRALEDFNKVLEINPSDVDALNHKNHTEQLLEQKKREFVKIFRGENSYANKNSSLEEYLY